MREYWVNDGTYGTEVGFPKQIQDRVEAGMGCGSSIGIGWLPMVVELDESLAKIDPDYKIDQIKEKFGGLRFYISSDANRMREMYDLIDIAEGKSFETCEMCGAAAERINNENGWMVVRCKEHSNDG